MKKLNFGFSHYLLILSIMACIIISLVNINSSGILFVAALAFLLIYILKHVLPMDKTNKNILLVAILFLYIDIFMVLNTILIISMRINIIALLPVIAIIVFLLFKRLKILK